MRWSDIFRFALTNLWRRKLRTFLTMIGAMIGTASIVVMVSLGIGINQGYIDSVSASGDITTITVNSNTYYGSGMYYDDKGGETESVALTDQVISQISAMEHVKVASPRLDLYNMQVKTGKLQSYYGLIAIDGNAAEDMGIKVSEGSYFTGKSGDTIEILLGEGVKSSFRNPKSNRWDGSEPDIDWFNAKFTVVLQDYNNTDDEGNPKEYEFKARVVGFIPDDGGEYGYNMYCDMEQLKPILNKYKKVFEGSGTKVDEYPNAVVLVDDFNNVLSTQEEITEMGLNCWSMADMIKSLEDSTKSLRLILGGIGGVAMLVAAISICNTMLMSIYERTREIGIMKVLGCKMSRIGALFLTEAGFIGLGGGAMGLILSFIISVIINAVLGASGSIDSFRSVIPPYLAISGAAFSVLVGIVAGLYPSRRAMKLSALAALRNE